MKSIKELENPDIISINGEKFQVINHTSFWYHVDKDELEMVVELVKVGQDRITSNYRLTYIYERPDEVTFSIFDEKSKKWRKQEIKTIEF